MASITHRGFGPNPNQQVKVNEHAYQYQLSDSRYVLTADQINGKFAIDGGKVMPGTWSEIGIEKTANLNGDGWRYHDRTRLKYWRHKFGWGSGTVGQDGNVYFVGQGDSVDPTIMVDPHLQTATLMQMSWPRGGLCTSHPNGNVYFSQDSSLEWIDTSNKSVQTRVLGDRGYVYQFSLAAADVGTGYTTTNDTSVYSSSNQHYKTEHVDANNNVVTDGAMGFTVEVMRVDGNGGIYIDPSKTLVYSAYAHAAINPTIHAGYSNIGIRGNHMGHLTGFGGYKIGDRLRILGGNDDAYITVVHVDESDVPADEQDGPNIKLPAGKQLWRGSVDQGNIRTIPGRDVPYSSQPTAGDKWCAMVTAPNNDCIYFFPRDTDCIKKIDPKNREVTMVTPYWSDVDPTDGSTIPIGKRRTGPIGAFYKSLHIATINGDGTTLTITTHTEPVAPFEFEVGDIIGIVCPTINEWERGLTGAQKRALMLPHDTSELWNDVDLDHWPAANDWSTGSIDAGYVITSVSTGGTPWTITVASSWVGSIDLQSPSSLRKNDHKIYMLVDATYSSDKYHSVNKKDRMYQDGGREKFQSATLGPDGMYYLLGKYHNYIARFDPFTDTVDWNYFALDPTNNASCNMPHLNNLTQLAINTYTDNTRSNTINHDITGVGFTAKYLCGEMSTADQSGLITDSTYNTQGYFNGMVLAPNGKLILIPGGYPWICEFDPIAKTLDRMKQHIADYASNSYGGGSAGTVYTKSTRILLDTTVDHSFNYAPEVYAWQGPFMGNYDEDNGGVAYYTTLWDSCHTETDVNSNYTLLSRPARWNGGTLAANGKIYVSKSDSSSKTGYSDSNRSKPGECASSLLEIDPEKGIYQIIHLEDYVSPVNYTSMISIDTTGSYKDLNINYNELKNLFDGSESTFIQGNTTADGDEVKIDFDPPLVCTSGIGFYSPVSSEIKIISTPTSVNSGYVTCAANTWTESGITYGAVTSIVLKQTGGAQPALAAIKYQDDSDNAYNYADGTFDDPDLSGDYITQGVNGEIMIDNQSSNIQMGANCVLGPDGNLYFAPGVAVRHQIGNPANANGVKVYGIPSTNKPADYMIGPYMNNW